jgi:hypothetical protein
MVTRKARSRHPAANRVRYGDDKPAAPYQRSSNHDRPESISDRLTNLTGR